MTAARARLIAAIALAVSLSGCDDLDRMLGIEKSDTNTAAGATNMATGNTSPSAPSDGIPAKPSGPADPAFAAEVAQAAADLQAELPMQVEPGTTVVALQADGTELVYDVTISRAIPAAQIELLQRTLQASNQASLCGNPESATFIRRGGSMYYRYTDAGGSRFESRVISCP